MHPLPWAKSSFLFFLSESDVWIFLYRETIVTLGFYCLWNNNIHRAVFKSFSLTSQYYFYLLEFSHSPTPCSFLCNDLLSLPAMLCTLFPLLRLSFLFYHKPTFWCQISNVFSNNRTKIWLKIWFYDLRHLWHIALIDPYSAFAGFLRNWITLSEILFCS